MGKAPRGIEACMTCGSRELRWISVADGGALGQAANLDLRICQHGHRGVPFLFESERDWLAFVDSVKHKPDASGSDDEPATR